ncbi:Yip1 family protein [Cytobacillus sp. FSL W7-1323]|uniref:Yip1 family protein n=1 Tax=Cytobacillus TaxID=2675230 RepID=UPI002781829F|nr:MULTISPECIES: Yip1 family protein [Cytobacillus]MDQ0185315.1 hypothetical protein [Cytobacillus kochii]MEA1854653.1 Yip1 family protein [Cytobacillus sp. OWB-43]MED1606007.1 Yip1 family protein [Cytobacillus kochii]
MEAELKHEVEEPKKPRLFGMIANPSEQFERIKQQPKIWVPLLLVTLLFTVGMIITASSMDPAYLGIDELSQAEQDMVYMISLIMFVIIGIISPIFTVLISSAIYLLICKIASSDVSFKQLFSMNTYILVISVIGLILNGVIRMIIGGNPELNVTSLASVLNAEATSVWASIEVFSIWQTILVGLGLHKVAGLSKGVAYGVAIAFFIISMIFALVTSTAV